MNKGVGISIGAICVIAIMTVFALTSTGLTLHNGSILKPDSFLKPPLISASCGETTCDTACIGDNDALVGVYLKGTCYVGLFDQD